MYYVSFYTAYISKRELLRSAFLLKLNNAHELNKELLCVTGGLANSTILGNKPDYLAQLKTWLSPVLRNSSTSLWHICWHGHSHGFAASTFHSRCDYKGPTVTIVRVGSYIFGGYTDYSWVGK